MKSKNYLTLKIPKIPKKNIKLAYAIICFIGLFLMIWILLKIFVYIGSFALTVLTLLTLQYQLLPITGKFFAGVILLYVLWSILVSLVNIAFKVTQSFIDELNKIKKKR